MARRTRFSSCPLMRVSISDRIFFFGDESLVQGLVQGRGPDRHARAPTTASETAVKTDTASQCGVASFSPLKPCHFGEGIGVSGWSSQPCTPSLTRDRPVTRVPLFVRRVASRPTPEILSVAKTVRRFACETRLNSPRQTGL